MNLNEMRRRFCFRGQKVQKQNNKRPNGNNVTISGSLSSKSRNEDVDRDWNDATQKAVNLLYQFEKCSFRERRGSLAMIEQLHVPSEYTVLWNQILRIWRSFVNDHYVNTKTLPNPDGVRYSIRPRPITSSTGVQDLIKEIIKNS